ncbi:uncharacterized protein LOC117001881 isoform X2 [Catharus ustulatus]|nr:uncharacterized protein LOC117001881 isoform X2 [Catharus ustulatus]
MATLCSVCQGSSSNRSSPSSTFFFQSNKAIGFPPTPSLRLPSPSLAPGLFIQNVETICRKVNNVSGTEGSGASLLCTLRAPAVKRCFLGGTVSSLFSFLPSPLSHHLPELFSSCRSQGQTRATRSERVLEDVQVGSRPAPQLHEAVSVYLIPLEVLLSDHCCSWISINEQQHVCSRGAAPGPGAAALPGVRHSYSLEQFGSKRTFLGVNEAGTFCSLISVFLPSPAEHCIPRASQHLAGSSGSVSVNAAVSLNALGWGSRTSTHQHLEQFWALQTLLCMVKSSKRDDTNKHASRHCRGKGMLSWVPEQLPWPQWGPPALLGASFPSPQPWVGSVHCAELVGQGHEAAKWDSVFFPKSGRFWLRTGAADPL